MKIEALHIGMKVQHPQYGIGLVKTIAEHTAEVEFAEGRRAISPEGSGLKPAEPQVAITGLDRPLELFVAETARAVMEEMGVDRPESVVEELGVRWHKGRLSRWWMNSGCAGTKGAWCCIPLTLRCSPKRCRWRFSSTRL